jgi:hypothetical protein
VHHSVERPPAHVDELPDIRFESRTRVRGECVPQAHIRVRGGPADGLRQGHHQRGLEATQRVGGDADLFEELATGCHRRVLAGLHMTAGWQPPTGEPVIGQQHLRPLGIDDDGIGHEMLRGRGRLDRPTQGGTAGYPCQALLSVARLDRVQRVDHPYELLDLLPLAVHRGPTVPGTQTPLDGAPRPMVRGGRAGSVVGNVTPMGPSEAIEPDPGHMRQLVDALVAAGNPLWTAWRPSLWIMACELTRPLDFDVAAAIVGSDPGVDLDIDHDRISCAHCDSEVIGYLRSLELAEMWRMIDRGLGGVIENLPESCHHLEPVLSALMDAGNGVLSEPTFRRVARRASSGRVSPGTASHSSWSTRNWSA